MDPMPEFRVAIRSARRAWFRSMWCLPSSPGSGSLRSTPEDWLQARCPIVRKAKQGKRKPRHWRGLRESGLPNGGLLDLHCPAGLFDLALELLGLVALDALLDGLGRLVHERLGLLEAETRG